MILKIENAKTETKNECEKLLNLQYSRITIVLLRLAFDILKEKAKILQKKDNDSSLRTCPPPLLMSNSGRTDHDLSVVPADQPTFSEDFKYWNDDGSKTRKRVG